MAIFIMTRLPSSIRPMVHISRLAPATQNTFVMKPTAFKIQNDTFIANRLITAPTGGVAVNPREDEPSV